MSALRVAVIGAGGNIGSTLLARLASEASVAARGICRNELTAAPLRLAGFDVRCGSVSDANEGQTLLGDCEVLINCASATALPGTARKQEREIVRGLLRVRGPRRLIHFSSVAVYGSCITGKNRFARPSPDYPFGREKLNLENYLLKQAAKSPLRELVILRMGHVYGAEQWVSRFVFDHLNVPGWRLPFDGRVASNAVHVKNVAAAVVKLVRSGQNNKSRQVGVLNLFDWPQSTLREVFDWNTSAIGSPRIAGLDEATSIRLREHYAGISRAPTRQLVREVMAWGKGLPLSLAASSQQLRFMALNALAALQSPRLEAHAIKRFFGGHAAKRRSPPCVEEPWVFSDPAPGPCVEYAREVNDDDARALVRWHRGYSNPDALVPFALLARDGVEAQA